jgi:hypothetical protein
VYEETYANTPTMLELNHHLLRLTFPPGSAGATLLYFCILERTYRLTTLTTSANDCWLVRSARARACRVSDVFVSKDSYGSNLLVSDAFLSRRLGTYLHGSVSLPEGHCRMLIWSNR